MRKTARALYPLGSLAVTQICSGQRLPQLVFRDRLAQKLIDAGGDFALD
jgi:hypothetical protein